MSPPDLDIEHLSESDLHALANAQETDWATLDLIVKYYLTEELLLQKVVAHPNVRKTTLNYIRLFVPALLAASLGLSQVSPEIFTPEAEEAFERERVVAISQLKIPEKIHLAMKGNREARTLLLKDPNRLVSLAVLESPKITDEEIEKVAQSKNMQEEVLRTVARNPAWIRRYPVIEALANNPKTPLSLSISFLKSLRGKDLERLSKNKGIPSALRNTAIKMLESKKTK
ncbi:MAG: hypothetical protein AAB300_00395 [Nitrospirota bacterium]